MSGRRLPDLGPYRVVSTLGEGGAGVVYKVEDDEGNQRALKLFGAPPAVPPQILAASRVAAYALAYVDSPHIVRMHEWHDSVRGFGAMMVMDLVEGEDLGQLIARREALHALEAVEIARQIADGLAAAHDAGVLHLDLKPANIRLMKVGNEFDAADSEDDRVVKILDFGSAADAAQRGAPPDVGTPEYWAPEQCAGGELDERTDVYALGIILYEMLTGNTPFSSHSYTSVAQAQMREPPAQMEPPAHTVPIPETLKAVVMRCLAKDPADRFQSAAALRDALAHVAEMTSALSRAQGKADLIMPGAVLGDYRVLSMLGEGAMGRVYLGEHARLERKVAIKVLRSTFAADPIASQRFFAEARAVARIGHENIVEITDFFDADPHVKYYVMELLKGTSLRKLIKNEGALSPERLVPIFVQISAALAATHAAGIVHRDLKPDNIFLTERHGRQDVVKLFDFGVAADLDDDPAKLGEGDVLVGTPQYMAPEQFSLGELDGRTDVYALGVLLYEALSGARPFLEKEIVDLAMAHLQTPPPPLPLRAGPPHFLDAGLGALAMLCLSKAQAERPYMAEVNAALTAMAETLVPEPAILEVVADNEPPGLSRGVLAIAGAVLGAAVLGAAGVVFALLGDDEPPAAAALPEAAVDVLVSFKSEPPGAAVFRKGESEPIGTTPFEHELPSSEEAAVFVLRLEGYEPVEQSVSLATNSAVNASLRKIPTSSSAPSGAAAASSEPAVTKGGRGKRAGKREGEGAAATQREKKPGGVEKVDGTIDPFAE